MEPFVQHVDKEIVPKALTTGARRDSKPLPRDPVTGPFLYNNVVKLVNSVLTLSPLNTHFFRLNDKCLRQRAFTVARPNFTPCPYRNAFLIHNGERSILLVRYGSRFKNNDKKRSKPSHGTANGL